MGPNKFDGIKKGDKVLFSMRHGSKGWAIKIVDAVTHAGNIKIGNQIFNKDGNERTSETWHRDYIKPFNQAEWDAIEARNRKIERENKIAERLKNLSANLQKQTLEDFTKIENLLTELGY